MWIIFDLLVVGILALFTFLGYKQGLVKAAIKILSFFIAIIVALILYKPISNVIISKTSIDDNIKNTIIQKITPDGIEQNEEIVIEDSLTSKIIGEANTTIEEIANTFSIKLIETVVLLILYIVIKIVLKFITVLTDLITNLPILKQINKAGRHSVWIVKRYINSICYISSCLFGFSINKTRYI